MYRACRARPEACQKMDASVMFEAAAWHLARKQTGVAGAQAADRAAGTLLKRSARRHDPARRYTALLFGIDIVLLDYVARSSP